MIANTGRASRGCPELRPDQSGRDEVRPGGTCTETRIVGGAHRPPVRRGEPSQELRSIAHDREERDPRVSVLPAGSLRGTGRLVFVAPSDPERRGRRLPGALGGRQLRDHLIFRYDEATGKLVGLTIVGVRARLATRSRGFGVADA